MNEKVTGLQKSMLKMIVNDAKQRIAFYYRTIFNEEKVQEILRELDSYYYGFDLDYEAAAYCNGYNHEIRVTSRFLSSNNYEQQVGIMVHEMNHAISHANKHNDRIEEEYDGAHYVSSYELLEEGLADVMSELIMNYYYDKQNPRVNYEPYRVNDFSCGYPYYRDVIKTLLAIMELQGIDKEMLQEYYFGDKDKLFKYIIQIGGEKIFDLIRMTKKNSRVLEVNTELFGVLEKNWAEAISKNSSMIYSKPNSNNLYYSDNFLLKRIHLTYCIERIIESANIDVDNITLEEIQKIYNATNGMLKELEGYLVPTIVDRIIVSWLNNCKIEEVHAIKRIIPGIFNMVNGKYYKLLIEKVLKERNGQELSRKDLSILVGALTDVGYEGIDELDSDTIEFIIEDNPSLKIFITEIYPKMSEEEKDLFRDNYRSVFQICDYKALEASVYKELLDLYNISSINELDFYHIRNLLNQHQDLIDKINSFNLQDIIEHIATVWLTGYCGEPDYIFKVFPSAIYNEKILEILKTYWNYSDENIEHLRKEIVGEFNNMKL